MSKIHNLAYWKGVFDRFEDTLDALRKESKYNPLQKLIDQEYKTYEEKGLNPRNYEGLLCRKFFTQLNNLNTNYQAIYDNMLTEVKEAPEEFYSDLLKIFNEVSALINRTYVTAYNIYLKECGMRYGEPDQRFFTY